ncbi:Opi1-domain-containing protein [Trametopsis cervina]|nr:Opi1-domain-containing protein [Trametopsis cervina]
MATVDGVNNGEHSALDDQDESVRIAVRALGDMRNSVHTSPSTSFQPTPALSISSRSTSPSLPEDEPDFVSRMSTFPIVNTALRAYEQGKASSRVVKYGAEMMESSVKTISRPVIDRLPVGQLDEFACRQLDRVKLLCRAACSPVEQCQQTYFRDSARPCEDRLPAAMRCLPQSTDGTSLSPAVDQTYSRTPTPRQEDPPANSSRPNTNSSANENQQQVAQRSRWQAVLLEAGGIGAAVSEESMRRLKYCLQWLQYATVHIDGQILVLRDFIASLQDSSSLRPGANAQLSEDHLQTLTNIRRDVVETIRQVVDVVSKYAGGALPEPARARVRQFILCLPQRWAQAASGPNGGPLNGASDPITKKEAGRGRGRSSAPYTYGPGEAGPSSRSRPASRAASPSSLRTPGPSRTTANGATHGATAGTATNAAQKILTLATESLDMLRAVTTVFKDSLEKADTWVERLRYVGVQRQNSSSIAPLSSLPTSQEDSPKAYREPLPPIQLTPGSSRAHSPVPGIASLHLPPLDPALYSQSSSYSRHPHHGPHGHHRHNRHGSVEHGHDSSEWDSERGRDRYSSLGEGPAKDLDALTLSSLPPVSSTRYSASTTIREESEERHSGRRSMDVDG